MTSLPLRAASTSASTISEFAPERYKVCRIASTFGSLAAWRNISTTGVKDSNGCSNSTSCLLTTLNSFSLLCSIFGMTGASDGNCKSRWLCKPVMENKRIRLTGPLTRYSSASDKPHWRSKYSVRCSGQLSATSKRTASPKRREYSSPRSARAKSSTSSSTDKSALRVRRNW